MGVVHRQMGRDGDITWEGIQPEPYGGGGASAGSCRHVLIGPKDGAQHFAVRYFEIPPRGQSSFEHHLHDQGVVILKGRARVLLGWEVHEVGPGDVVYIPQNEQHQFENIGDEPLGFLCVIPSKEWLAKIQALGEHSG
ncbi:MAG: cupin domain-containing protein [candidate division NC10 bacterium]|jgi:quercetin dioxygenase-like cupin family protein|nr:cupin domain-containing protein [candidate division NC10 bacterium]